MLLSTEVLILVIRRVKEWPQKNEQQGFPFSVFFSFSSKLLDKNQFIL